MAFSRQAESNKKLATSSSIQLCISASVVANNDDLLTEILLCLPIKCLLKFKSVSKRWLSLITNPTFSQRCSPYPNTASGLFLQSFLFTINDVYHFVDLNPNPDALVLSNARAPFKSLSSLLNQRDARILQSCNGLLLCFSQESDQTPGRYFVLNPTTKHYSVLPPIGSAQAELGTVLAMTLAFDPSKSPHYKVVCVRSCNCPILIYSSDNGPWRVSGSSLPDTEEFDVFNYGVFWNEAIHWVCSVGNCFYFKLHDEQLREMPMPQLPDFWDERCFWYFGESRDHLHLIEMNSSSLAEFDVYEMERDHSRWYMKYHLNLGPLPVVFPDVLGNHVNPSDDDQFTSFSMLSIIRSEIDEDSYLVLEIPGKIVRYNFQNKSFHELCESAAEFRLYHSHQYIESLCCV